MSTPSADIAPLQIELPANTGRPAKRSFSIRGHRTSISLETPFWEAFVAIAAQRQLPVARLVAAIDAARGEAGLSSAIRVFVLKHYRDAANGDFQSDGRVFGASRIGNETLEL